MTRDDIIRMAREAGYKHPDAVGDAEDFAYFDFERFTALVAAAEREAIAQPEQERDRGGACVVVNGTSGVFTVPLPGKPGGGGVSPAPQREWQGLTDEERQECLYSDPIFGMAMSTFARAIEAELKEKNA